MCLRRNLTSNRFDLQDQTDTSIYISSRFMVTRSGGIGILADQACTMTRQILEKHMFSVATLLRPKQKNDIKLNKDMFVESNAHQLIFRDISINCIEQNICI